MAQGVEAAAAEAACELGFPRSSPTTPVIIPNPSPVTLTLPLTLTPNPNLNPNPNPNAIANTLTLTSTLTLYQVMGLPMTRSAASELAITLNDMMT